MDGLSKVSSPLPANRYSFSILTVAWNMCNVQGAACPAYGFVQWAACPVCGSVQLADLGSGQSAKEEFRDDYGSGEAGQIAEKANGNGVESPANTN